MNYVTVSLQGGLGNQMFQIAFIIALAKRLGVEYKLSLDAYTPMQARKPFFYQKNIFKNIKFEDGLIPEYAVIEEQHLYLFNDYWLKEVVSKIPVTFQGYFQSLDYFENIKAELLAGEIFCTHRDAMSDLLNRILGKKSTTIGVHIRRGDYLTVRDVLPVLDKSYFYKAIDMIDPTAEIIVFSDDKDTAREWFPKSVVVDGLEDFEEMSLMSVCDHNVISNSSFSWWGSFLNTNENKKVCAPSIWVNHATPKNIYRDNMTIINVENRDGFLYA